MSGFFIGIRAKAKEKEVLATAFEKRKYPYNKGRYKMETVSFYIFPFVFGKVWKRMEYGSGIFAAVRSTHEA